MTSVARRVLTGAVVAVTAAAVVGFGGGAALADPAVVATTWSGLQADVTAGGLVVLGASITGYGDVTAGDRYYGYLPTVTAISPNRGPSSGGQTITVTGSAFSGTRGTTTVTFGNVLAYAVVDSDTELTVTVPAHVSGGGYAKGVVYLNVTTDVGVAAHTPADLYTYTG